MKHIDSTCRLCSSVALSVTVGAGETAGGVAFGSVCDGRSDLHVVAVDHVVAAAVLAETGPAAYAAAADAADAPDAAESHADPAADSSLAVEEVFPGAALVVATPFAAVAAASAIARAGDRYRDCNKLRGSLARSRCMTWRKGGIEGVVPDS